MKGTQQGLLDQAIYYGLIALACVWTVFIVKDSLH
jgi:hypothetical protein